MNTSSSPPTSRWINAKPTISATPRQRQAIGFLEEYFAGSTYLGWRMVAESAQAIGSENRQEFRLESDLVVNRSFSKVKRLTAGTVVCRLVSPLQGKEIPQRIA